jgi:RimJ/RimL family protein N-acetyltransferase
LPTASREPAAGRSPRIRDMKIGDVRRLHRFYQQLSEEGRRLFRPFFLAAERRDRRWLLAQLALGLSCWRPVRALLVRLSPKAAFCSLVVEDERQEVIGFAYLKRIDRRSADLGIAIADGHQGQRLGSRLLTELIDLGRRDGLDTVHSVVLPDNEKSLLLHDRAGFRRVGMTREAGTYQGQRRDHVELRLDL